jgi:phage shock protein C
MTSMPTDNVFLRNDTIFGACQAIGDDFGFNPNYIRVPLAAAMLASPLGAIAFYVGLSVLVLASRLLFRSKEVPASAAAAPVAELLVEANDDQRELIAA